MTKPPLLVRLLRAIGAIEFTSDEHGNVEDFGVNTRHPIAWVFVGPCLLIFYFLQCLAAVFEACWEEWKCPGNSLWNRQMYLDIKAARKRGDAK